MKDNFLITASFIVMVAASIVSRCESGDDHDRKRASYKYKVCPQHVRKTDWPTFFAHEEYCSKYYVCDHGVPKQMDCAPGTVFNDHLNTCVHPGSQYDTCTPVNAGRECARGHVDLIPHPTACHRYFNCSDIGSAHHHHHNPLGAYGKECSFPNLFDVISRRCVHFKRAECGHGRLSATWECEYSAQLCRSGHCIPCSLFRPTCVGKEDGKWPHNEKLWSPYYVYCHGQRSRNGEERCPKHELTGSPQLFDPVKRCCVNLWEVPRKYGGLEPSCERKQSGTYIVEDTPTVSYSCPGKSLFWCNPPLYVDANDHRCIPF